MSQLQFPKNLVNFVHEKTMLTKLVCFFKEYQKENDVILCSTYYIFLKLVNYDAAANSKVNKYHQLKSDHLV